MTAAWVNCDKRIGCLFQMTLAPVCQPEAIAEITDKSMDADCNYVTVADCNYVTVVSHHAYLQNPSQN